MSVTSLEGTSARPRHIILLTDGWSSSGSTTMNRQHEGRPASPSRRSARAAARTRSSSGSPSRAAAGSTPRPTRPASPTSSSRRRSRSPASRSSRSRSSRSRRRRRRSCAGSRTGLPQLRGYNGTTIKAGGAERARHRPRRSAPRPVAVRAGPVRRLDVGTTGRWAKDWVGWSGFAGSSASSVVDVPGRGDRRHRGHVRDDRRRPASTSRASSRTAPRAISTRRSAVVVGPDLEPRDRGTWSRSHPGVYQRAPRRDRSGRLRRAHHPVATGVDAAGSDGRAGRPDRGRVPASSARMSH